MRRESGQLLDKLVELELGDFFVYFGDNGHVGRLANGPDDTLLWTDRHRAKLYSFRSREQDTPGGQ